MIAEDLFKKIMRSKDDINDEDITEMLEEYYRCIRKQRDKYKLSRLDIQTIVVVPLPILPRFSGMIRCLCAKDVTTECFFPDLRS